MVDITRNVGARASRAYSVSRILHGMGDNQSDVLKAAGVPMITPLPLISLARLTLFPGEFSTRTSRSGMESPFWTKAGAVLWKRARWEKARGREVATRRVANILCEVLRWI